MTLNAHFGSKFKAVNRDTVDVVAPVHADDNPFDFLAPATGQSDRQSYSSPNRAAISSRFSAAVIWSALRAIIRLMWLWLYSPSFSIPSR